jgi:hypothetical protein
MANELNQWPVSLIDKMIIEHEVARFLRTHRDGAKLLLDWLSEVPPDRTEDEFKQQRQRRAKRHEWAVQAQVERVNAARASAGLGPIDRKGNILSGPGAPRNRKARDAARSTRSQIEALLRRKPTLVPKQILRIMGWPSSKLRMVQRHLKSIRE